MWRGDQGNRKTSLPQVKNYPKSRLHSLASGMKAGFQFPEPLGWTFLHRPSGGIPKGLQRPAWKGWVGLIAHHSEHTWCYFPVAIFLVAVCHSVKAGHENKLWICPCPSQYLQTLTGTRNCFKRIGMNGPVSIPLPGENKQKAKTTPSPDTERVKRGLNLPVSWVSTSSPLSAPPFPPSPPHQYLSFLQTLWKCRAQVRGYTVFVYFTLSIVSEALPCPSRSSIRSSVHSFLNLKS